MGQAPVTKGCVGRGRRGCCRAGGFHVARFVAKAKVEVIKMFERAIRLQCEWWRGRERERGKEQQTCKLIKLLINFVCNAHGC